MKKQDKEILCSLIRDHEDTVGSSRVTMMAMKAFIESIKAVTCDVAEARDLYYELAETIKNTEPKVIPLIHLIEEFEKEVRGMDDATIDQVKQRAIQILEEKHEKIKTKVGKVIEHGLTCINEGDVIIVHTISFDVTNMLKLAREVLHKNFKVIVLKQDPWPRRAG
jgi:translation initiation factor eIF-2B subunit alpha